MNDHIALLEDNLKQAIEALNKNRALLEEEQTQQKNYFGKRKQLLIESPEDPRIASFKIIYDEIGKRIESMKQQNEFYEKEIDNISKNIVDQCKQLDGIKKNDNYKNNLIKQLEEKLKEVGILLFPNHCTISG